MPEPADETDDQTITCWCGAEGTYEELFDDSTLDRRCGRSGELNCYCGGDQCVCHHHGRVDCDGCEDCDQDDWDDDDFAEDLASEVFDDQEEP